MIDMEDRKAFDLFNPVCRKHFIEAIKEGKWRSFWWWALVISDTYNRVSS